MLKGILFDFVSAVAESLFVQKLLQELEPLGIRYVFCTHGFSSGSATTAPFPEPFSLLSLPGTDCLILTDSAAGVLSARTAKVPCIGYAPPESSEDLSGAYAVFEDFASIDVNYLCRTHAHALGYPAHILSTERLTVREFSEADFPALYTMCTEPSTASFMEDTPSDYNTEQEKHRAYLRNVYPFFDLALWGVYEKTSGTLIGRAGFSLPSDASELFSLGYLIDISYRHRGYAKELIPALLIYAKEQGYSKVNARIKVENAASIKVLEQCGFPYKLWKNTTQGILSYLIYMTV